MKPSRRGTNTRSQKRALYLSSAAAHMPEHNKTCGSQRIPSSREGSRARPVNHMVRPFHCEDIQPLQPMPIFSTTSTPRSGEDGTKDEDIAVAKEDVRSVENLSCRVKSKVSGHTDVAGEHSVKRSEVMSDCEDFTESIPEGKNIGSKRRRMRRSQSAPDASGRPQVVEKQIQSVDDIDVACQRRVEAAYRKRPRSPSKYLLLDREGKEYQFLYYGPGVCSRNDIRRNEKESKEKDVETDESGEKKPE